MEIREKLLDMIKVNSSNEEFTAGDALLAILPIDYIKNSEINDAAISICYEKSQSLQYEVINAILATIDLVTEGHIIKGTTSHQEVIGSEIQVMRPYSHPEHCQVVEIIPTTENVWEILRTHFTVS